ncbi:MAG: DUF4080 domain-containing protein, partial [Alistipes sp.]|nr:DUF4080 domain-containing protein [Alistipes sp.]
ETYYNSGKFLNTLEYLVPLYETPFAFFEQLSQYWIQTNCHHQVSTTWRVLNAENLYVVTEFAE